MSLRKQKTSGGPGTTRRDPAVRTKFRSRAQREAETNRLVLIITAIIAAVIIVLVGGALLIDNVIRPSQSVASVGSAGIPLNTFQQRVMFERWQRGLELAQVYQNQYYQQQLADPSTQYGQLYAEMVDPSQFGKAVLTEMVNAELVKQYAAQHNITVSDKEVQDAIGLDFGFSPNGPTATPTASPTATLTPIVSATPTPSPTVTPVPSVLPTATTTPFPTGIPTNTPGPTAQKQTFDKNVSDVYSQAAKSTGLSTDQAKTLFTEVTYERLLIAKVEADAAIGGPLKATQDEVKARHILVASEAAAKSVIAALKTGESFAQLASAVSTDTGSGAQGGELGWEPHSGKYVAEFESYLWDSKTTVGSISDPPIKTQFGYHVIQLEAKQSRLLTDQEQQDVQTHNYNNWLTKTKADLNVKTYDSVWTANVPTTPTLDSFGVPSTLSQGAGSGLSGLNGLTGQ